jgi:hypothetical protein
MTAFSLAPGPAGPRYNGPHGPIDVPADQAPHRTRVHTPAGEATLEWGMMSDDRAALERGAAMHLGGRELVLRRDGRALVVDGLLEVRRRRFGRVELARPGGTTVAWFKRDLSGEVAERATPEDVTVMVLVMASNAAGTLERRVPLLPFTMPA